MNKIISIIRNELRLMREWRTNLEKCTRRCNLDDNRCATCPRKD